MLRARRFAAVLRAVGAVLVAMLALAGCAPPARRAPPRAIDGVLDAQGWDLGRDGPLPLVGEWRVAWNVEAEEVVGMPPDRREVPGAILAGPHPDEWDRGTGMATFVVRVVGLAAGPSRSLYVPSNYATRVRCSSDTEVLEGGRNTRDTPDARLSMAGYAGPCPSDDLTVAITLRVPGYLDGATGSGLTSEPVLMTASDALDAADRRLVVDTVLATLVFAFAIVLALEALTGRVELAPWVFMASALAATFWSASTTEILERLGMRNAPLRLRLEYACVPWVPAIFLAATARAKTIRMPAAAWGVAWLGIVAGVATLALPGASLRTLLAAGQASSVLTGVVIIAAGLRAIADRRATGDARLFATGVLAPATFGIADVLIAHAGMPSLRLFPWSMVALFLVVAFVTLRRSAAARGAAENLARAAKRFMPEEFLHALGHDDITTVELGEAAARDVSILFADIRDFTTLSEHMTPEETFGFLNRCLSRMGPHVRHHGGFVDKYIGDAIMALFPDSANDAIRAAIAMQRETRGDGERGSGLEIGVGIHRGQVMMGTIGEASRFEATVIADAVNLTARLESLTKQFGCGILVSGEVAALLDDDLLHTSRRLGTFAVKGRSAPVDVFEIFASDPDATRATKLGSRERLRRMLAHHGAGELEDAIAIAGELRDEHPEDGPIAWWFVRLQHELVEGEPSPGGVVRLVEK
jgi:class 3 adenylate cyclase